MDQNNGRELRPKIAYLMSRFPRITETFILREMLELERAGYSIIILPLLGVQQPVRHRETERLKDRVHYTPFISLPILAANLHFLRRAPLRYLKLLWSVLEGNFGSANLFFGAVAIFPKSVYFAKLTREFEVSHVHAHFATHPALAALIISELSGVNFSLTVHAHDIFVHKAMLGEKLRKARFVAAISEFNRQYLLKLFPDLSSDKIKIVRCGIKPEDYDFEKKSGEKKDVFKILSVASLQPYKGIEYLIRACAFLRNRIRNLQCTVIGEGEDRSMLESMIAELGLTETVHLIGARPQNEVTEYFKGADLFVLPSVVAPDGQMEGIPVALMEAMASRLPVVSTRLSGIPELVADAENGLLVAPRDAKALSEAIYSLYENPGLRARMGEAGRYAVGREYDLRRNVKKLTALFDESIADSPQDDFSIAGENILDSAALEQVENELRAVLPKNSATVTNFPRAVPVSGADSAVYALTFSGAGGTTRDVVLKLHRPARHKSDGLNGATKNAENEFRALSLLWNDFGARGERFRVPEPLVFIPEQAALITEKCEGERLDNLLRLQIFDRKKATPAEILRAAESCGQWLAKFHAVTRRESDKTSVVARLQNEFYDDVQTCKKFGFDPAMLDRAAEYFENVIKLIEESDEKIVSEHCDFGPHNIFVEGGTITVIDFEGMQDGLIYDDLAYFLCLVEVMPFYHLSRGLNAKIRDGFLKGYAGKTDFDAELLKFYQVPVMIKIAAHNPAFATGGGRLQFLRRLARRRAYSKWLEARLK